MITFQNIILRDFHESDIEKRIYWETEETEWQLWDAPWETDVTAEEKEAALCDYVDTMHTWAERSRHAAEEEKRYAFQIAINDSEQTYIGWVSSYDIDDDYNYTEEEGHLAIGIDIPERSARGKGYACQALCAFIDYLFEHGETELYTQTWSGNERMIHIALKIGFEECCRKAGIRFVRGKTYDALTFRLNREKYRSRKPELF